MSGIVYREVIVGRRRCLGQIRLFSPENLLAGLPGMAVGTVAIEGRARATRDAEIDIYESSGRGQNSQKSQVNSGRTHQ